jgi:hypothetical protein
MRLRVRVPRCFALILLMGMPSWAGAQSCQPRGEAAPRATLPEATSWAFRPSYYSHDPDTGERVAQYSSPPPRYTPSDPTYFQSGYRYLRSNIRGLAGSSDQQLIVESWGNGRGLRGAQSEREFDVWRQGAIITRPQQWYYPGYGGPGHGGPGYGGPGYGGPGYGGPGYGGPGYGGPGYGGPGYGGPGYGGPGYGGPGYGGP